MRLLECLGWVVLLFCVWLIAEPSWADCPECVGSYQHDIAIDRPTIGACSPSSTWSPLEYEIYYESPGPPPRLETGCYVEVPIYTDYRVKFRARYLGVNEEWSEWSAWARRLHPTQEQRFTCLGDFNFDGMTNAADFVLFRQHYNHGSCE